MKDEELIQKAWLKLIDENEDVFDEVSDDLREVEVKVTPRYVINFDKTKAGLADTKLDENGFPYATFGTDVLDLPLDDILDVLLHEMAHCAVGIEYGTLFKPENGGHNDAWHWYVDMLNDKGHNIVEVGDKYKKYLNL
jgi:hypothetical protein